MLGKDELIKSLQEINDKRLLSSEVTALLAPFKEATFPLSLEFISHSRTFGKQEDSVYDGGQTCIFKLTDLGIECAVLFGPEDSDMIEGHKPGNRLEYLVRYLDYDSLYKRVIMGKVGPLTTEDEKVTDEVSPSSVNKGANEPEIEVLQGSDSVLEEVQKRARGSSLKSKKKKKRILSFSNEKRNFSFSRPVSISAGQKRDWLAERSAQEGIKERQLKNAIAPILMAVGIIFCLNGCSKILPDGEGFGSFVIGNVLLVVGLSLRIHDKRK